MPELPEVETVRRGLEPVLAGRRIDRAEARRPDLRWPLPERFAERLTGRRVAALGRRSKYLLADLEPVPGRAPAETLIIHLGMSGRLLIEPPGDSSAGDSTVGDSAAGDAATGNAATEAVGAFHHPAPIGFRAHDHVVIETDAARIVYNDARRFGSMDLCETAAFEAHRLIAGLGPEPLSNGFSGAVLAEAFAERSASVKARLLDQRVVAGLGNIYVCEALWRAKIRPDRAAGGVSRRRVEALTAAVREVLEDAIAAGGSSLRDYRQADGELGYFQHAFAVYGRAEAPCRREGCAGVVARIVQQGRSSFFCPRCQR